MERSLAVMWTCLLGAGLVLVPLQALSPPSVLPPPFSVPSSKTVLQPPRLIGCVFLNRANVTCRWEAGDTSGMTYTLAVEKIAEITNSSLDTFTCTTTDTSCTAITGSSVRFFFCITVTAHGHNWNISSERRCQPGRIEVMLPPVPLDSVVPVRGRPKCLIITWRRILGEFPVSESEIKAGNLKSQIEFAAQGQFNVRVENVPMTNNSFQVCHFRPDTSYTIRLRHRYRGPESPWSPWSNANKGNTGEDAPSAAPAFWRRVKQTDKSGWRLVSLLWKPLPHFLANGRVLFFGVTCQTDSAQILNDHGSCRHLHNESTSCSLRLPAGRCSCALTASTSAGTSPEARIWLFGAFETEPPAPNQITASPLDDSSVDVRWTPPVDRSASGFVVEWFAVREESTSVLYWETLNSSSTSLVITEGVKPMERYAVSVKALYGEQWVGQGSTVHIYTRQGAPSAGPKVQVQQIFGSTVEIIWSPVPVELRHGFIRNYTIVYSSANQTTRRVLVPGHVRRYSLKNLWVGNYNIFMQANTDAGAGAAGPIANVHIGEASDEISILMSALLPVMLTSLALALMACLAQSKMVKQKLCQDVPDPSNSSLVHWIPKITLENLKRPAMAEKADIKYSQVVLLGESELQNSSPEKDLNYQSVCHLQTHTQTPQNTRNLERSIKNSTRTKTTSYTDLSSCPSIYSNIVFSHTLKNHPSPLRSPSYLQPNDWHHSTVSVNDVKIQLGGAGEPPVSLQGKSTQRSNSPQTQELKTLHHFLRQHQSPISFSDFSSSISSSSVWSPDPAEVTSPQHNFSQSQYNSVPSLQPDTFAQTNHVFDTFTDSFSPFPHSVSVDFSYCPLECDPYIPSAL